MPELPEVESVRSSVAKALTGRRLTSFVASRPDLRWPMPLQELSALEGKRLESVTRRAKYLILEFAGGAQALVHLGMSGRLVVEARSKEPPWETHEHWRMRFSRQLLRYSDPRRFGALLHAAPGRPHPLLQGLGPEPRDCDPDRWHASTRGRRSSIKSFLLDQRRIVGVGNIYACEALFRAGIRPRTRVGRISRERWRRLHDAVLATMDEALAAGGTTLRDYVDATGQKGRNQERLRVYGRSGEPCLVCGEPVASSVIGGRSTFYCPSCQR